MADIPTWAQDEHSAYVRQEVGIRIRQAREERGLSQATLADTIGRRQAYISELETGKTEPNASTLVILGRALHKPVAYFFPDHLRQPEGYILPTPDELTLEEGELIKAIRSLEPSFQYHLALRLVNTLVDYDKMADDILNR